MKQPEQIATHATENSGRSVGRLVGLGILTVIVLCSAAWLLVQGHKSVAVESMPPLEHSAALARFNAELAYLPNESLLGFVEIPAGAFVMGSDPAVDTMAFENEQWSTARNQGSMELPQFYINRYEVTVAQFRAFVQVSHYKADVSALSGALDHPVVHVSWTDALAYSRWLEQQLQQSPHTPALLKQALQAGWRVTLPTEAQWEKSARSVDGRIYPWGNVVGHQYANYASADTTAVGSFACPQCAYGLADMSGNVWELTRSPYRPYPFDAKSPPNLQTPALFVMRGGSFQDADNTIRAAVRGGIDPGARRPFIGFRVVLSPP